MIRNYIKIALKVLLRRKVFTFISLFAISFTLIVLMVATSLLDHLFGAFPPETRSNRTIGVYFLGISGDRPNGGLVTRTGGPGYGFLDRYVRTLPGAENVTLFSSQITVVSYKDGSKISSWLKRTDGQFWEILQFDFLEGGAFTRDDERNASFVAVINEATRDRFFGGGPAVGKTIEADGQRFRVVGVVRNVPFSRVAPFADIWVPISTSKSDAYKREFVGDFMALILAKSRADLPRLREEFQAARARAEPDLPDPKSFQHILGGAETLFEAVSRVMLSTRLEESRPGRLFAMLVLFALLFMLLPAINLMNLNVSRIMERAPEIGVRKAFGASSWTLVGQFVTENLVLTLLGGAIGLAGSAIALGLLNASGLLPYAQFHLNLRIFGYGFLLAVVFGLFSGVWPAWRMSRLHAVDALRMRMR